MSTPNLFGFPDKVGLRGDRVALQLCFRRKIEFEKGHSARVYLFEDERGNHFAWFTDSVKLLKANQTYRLTATIKRHRSFQGIPQTVLENCRFQ